MCRTSVGRETKRSGLFQGVVRDHIGNQIGSIDGVHTNVAANLVEASFAAYQKISSISKIIPIQDVSIERDYEFSDSNDTRVVIQSSSFQETVQVLVNRVKHIPALLERHVDLVDMVLREVTCGLHHLHCRGFVHGNINVNSVVTTSFADRINVYINDFSSLHQVTRPYPARLTTSPHPLRCCLLACAPEALSTDPLPLCDAYSLGIVLFYVITGRHFTVSRTSVEVVGASNYKLLMRCTHRANIIKLQDLPPDRLTDDTFPATKVECNVNPSIIRWVRALLIEDPVKRLTIAQLYANLNLPPLTCPPPLVLLPFTPVSSIAKTFIYTLIDDVFQMAKIAMKCVEAAPLAVSIASRYAINTWNTATAAAAEVAATTKAAEMAVRYPSYEARRQQGIVNYAYNWVIQEDGRPPLNTHEIRACLNIAIATLNPNHDRVIDLAGRRVQSDRTRRVIVRILQAIDVMTFYDTADWILIRDHGIAVIDYDLLRILLLKHHGDEQQTVSAYVQLYYALNPIS